MIKLSLADLQKYRPCNNMVLLKPAIDTSKFKYGSVEFYSPISLADGKPYDPFSTAPIVCSVINTPKKLIFGTQKTLQTFEYDKEMSQDERVKLMQDGKETKYTESEYVETMVPGSMQWKTKMEVKAGDIVWCNSNSFVIAEQYHQTIECEKTLYYLIPYSDIFLKKAGEKVVMINGYLLLSQVKERDLIAERARKLGLSVPSMPVQHGKYNDTFARVRYIGEKVEYIFNNKDRFDYPEIKLGDIVKLTWENNRRLEQPGHRYFSDEEFIVSRRPNITAVMSN
jgi:hypothetical protein